MRFTLQATLALVSLSMLLLAGVALAAPAKGMRYKTIADELDTILRTKDLAWLKKTFGRPVDTVTTYPGYTVLRWKAPKETTDCKVAFVFANSAPNVIEGWSTNCPTEVGNKAYGELAASAPVPNHVIPAAFARVVNQIKPQGKVASGMKRKASFADWLSTYVGKTEEQVYVDMKKLTSSETLHNGKVIKTYSRTVLRSEALDDYYYTCHYSLSFLKGVVVGYDQGNCSTGYFENDVFVPAETPVAPESAL